MLTGSVSLIVVAVLCLTAFHPGYCFPPMRQKNKVVPNGIMEKDPPSSDNVSQEGQV